MGRLSGFRYREIIRRLKQFGFTFDRQAAGSHEIWYCEATGRLYDYSQPFRGHAGRDVARYFATSRNLSR